MNRSASSHLPVNLGRRLIGPPTLISVTLFVILGALAGTVDAGSSVKPARIPVLLAEKGKNLTALKAIMSVKSSYDGGKNRQDLKGFLLYRRPSDFRFQGVGPAGNPLFELVIKSGAFQLFIPAERKLIKGRRDCFGRRFPDVAEIDSLIPLALLQWKTVRFEKLVSEDSENTVINFRYGGKLWGATLDPRSLLLKRVVRLTSSGRIDLTADFSGFSDGKYGWLPRKFEVKSPVGRWRTFVRIEKMETNPFLVEKNFRLQPAFSPKIEECR